MNSPLTHFDARGQAHMVDVATKAETHRVARAAGAILMQPQTLAMIAAGGAKKGDVLGVARIAAILLACLPIAFFVTILLLPLWSWVEATYGIESVGHSGPADWCFAATYVLVFLAALSIRLWTRRRA